MEVIFEQRDQDLLVDPSSISSVVEEVLSFEGCSPDQVIVHFVTIEEICQIHLDHFGDPSPTDCITFPIDPIREGAFQLLGEVFICPKIAIETSQELSISPLTECTLYLVHTLLHLIGYLDGTDEENQVMRAKENLHMAHLCKKNLLLKPRSS